LTARETWPDVTNKDADGIERLWKAVLVRQIKDAVDPEANELPIVQYEADVWLKSGSEGFRDVCDAAGRSPSQLRHKYVSGEIKAAHDKARKATRK
jgi:hypothetical protein